MMMMIMLMMIMLMIIIILVADAVVVILRIIVVTVIVVIIIIVGVVIVVDVVVVVVVVVIIIIIVIVIIIVIIWKCDKMFNLLDDQRFALVYNRKFDFWQSPQREHQQITFFPLLAALLHEPDIVNDSNNDRLQSERGRRGAGQWSRGRPVGQVLSDIRSLAPH